MRNALRIALCGTLLGLALCACGNKGDLVLPEPPEPAEAAADG